MKSTRKPVKGPPPDASKVSQVDLTSLVDVTFQLLVFLLVVNDLSANQIEPVDLPPSRFATEAKASDSTVVVNVLAPESGGDVRLRMGGQTLSPSELGDALVTVADLHRPPTRPDAPSDAAIFVRADKGAPWRHVQLVLQECVRQDVRIHRVQLGAESASTGNDVKEDSR